MNTSSNISNAAAVLKEKGEKLTLARKAIIDVLEASKQLLSVADIYDALRKRNVNVNYSTVYRNLDVLYKHQIVEKLIFAEEAKYKLNVSGEHLHHLICKSCQNTEILPYCPYHDLEKVIRSHTDFLPLEHKLEIYGYCSACQKTKCKS